MSFADVTAKMDQDKVKERTEEISRMILDYLHRNPAAEDTLEGIAKWWMNAQKIEFSTREVGEALENLVEQGKIRIIKRKDSSTGYAIGDQNRFDHSHD